MGSCTSQRQLADGHRFQDIAALAGIREVKARGSPISSSEYRASGGKGPVGERELNGAFAPP